MRVIVIIGLSATVVGCISWPSKLVDLNEERICSAARQEIKVKCPNFDIENYVPEYIYVSKSAIPLKEEQIGVKFISKQVREKRIERFGNPTRTAYMYLHDAVTVNMSARGKLMEPIYTPRSPDETGYLHLGWSAVRTPDEDYMSTHGFEFVAPGGVKDRPAIESSANAVDSPRQSEADLRSVGMD